MAYDRAHLITSIAGLLGPLTRATITLPSVQFIRCALNVHAVYMKSARMSSLYRHVAETPLSSTQYSVYIVYMRRRALV